MWADHKPGSPLEPASPELRSGIHHRPRPLSIYQSKVPSIHHAKVPSIYQSSGEGALGMPVACRTCPTCIQYGVFLGREMGLRTRGRATEPFGPFGPKVTKKSENLKRVFQGLLAPGRPKSPRRVNRKSKMSQDDPVLTLLLLYGRPRPEGPERLFSDFFVTLGPKGPRGSVARPRVLKNGHCSGTPNPHNLSGKYWQYTSNLYRSTRPICNAVPCRLLSFEERETPQYTSYLYRSTPPICTGSAFERTYQWLGA